MLSFRSEYKQITNNREVYQSRIVRFPKVAV